MDKFRGIEIFFQDFTIDIDDNHVSITSSSKCLEFIYNENDPDYGNNRTIFISELNRCVHSGTLILEKLELFANYKNCKYLILEDQSYLKYDNININLAAISILANGASWYNSLGFTYPNYEADRLVWEDIRNSSFDDVVSKLTEIEFQDIRSKGWFDDVFNIYDPEDIINSINYLDVISECIEYVYSTGTNLTSISIKKASAMIFVAIKDKRYKADDEIFRIYLVYIALISYLIPYQRVFLTKELTKKRKIEDIST